MSILTLFSDLLNSKPYIWFESKPTVASSELSNPIEVLKKKSDIQKQEYKLKVLRELSKYVTPVCSHDFLQDTWIWSADKRLSEIHKEWLCNMEIRKEWRVRRWYWIINDNWLKALWKVK